MDMIAIRSGVAALASVLMAGCAVDSQDAKSTVTGSLKPRSEASSRSPAKSSDDTMRAFCAQRHVDYQAGKAPGGAKSLGQKQADDRLCEALARQG